MQDWNNSFNNTKNNLSEILGLQVNMAIIKWFKFDLRWNETRVWWSSSFLKPYIELG
jgi:hypothetical protein